MSTENDGPSSKCEYAPYTQGSAFTYLNINQSQDSTTYTLTVNGDTTINGNNYRKLGDDSVFMCSGCTDGTYTQVASLLSFDGYTASDLRITYLKDFLPLGSTWSDTINVTNNGISTTAYLQYTITEKGTSRVVNGIAFTDVIAVQMDASASVLSSTMPIGTLSTSYYARGVGLIEADQAQDTTRLIKYNIK
ncbi:hypothetical protein [Chitinophaga sp. Cy-1792]|uniref:hypothetical protein n=1 Tax=Chitinophaga sp. Cy-1792 TaxID=2608339 RepID=UPI00141E1907|nr:hypothetical protein [Chitinophaga sp. Cy-1792]NIG52354.1 hypothetical protein [Chitinophaga sp. Cy-1792]